MRLKPPQKVNPHETATDIGGCKDYNAGKKE